MKNKNLFYVCFKGVRAIYAVLILAGMILLFGAIFYMSYRKGVWERFFEEFRNTVDEAHLIKTDLHDMLNQSIGISQAMVDGIDARMDELNQLQEGVKSSQLMLLQENVRNIQMRMLQQISEKRLPLPQMGEMISLPESTADIPMMAWADEEPDRPLKIRVYELARELNMNSKELVVTLQELGFPVNNQLNTLDYELTLTIKQKLTLIGPDTASSSKPDLRRERVLSLDAFKHTDYKPLDIEALQEAHPYIAVRTLQEAGYSVCEMAQFLNRGQGEINLIINLINKKKVYA